MDSSESSVATTTVAVVGLSYDDDVNTTDEKMNLDDHLKLRVNSEDIQKIASPSERSIFSSIRERLDPLTTLLQERIEGTKERFDRKLRKSNSAAETEEVLMNALKASGDASSVGHDLMMSSGEKSKETTAAAAASSQDDVPPPSIKFKKSTSADFFPSRWFQFFGDSIDEAQQPLPGTTASLDEEEEERRKERNGDVIFDTSESLIDCSEEPTVGADVDEPTCLGVDSSQRMSTTNLNSVLAPPDNVLRLPSPPVRQRNSNWQRLNWTMKVLLGIIIVVLWLLLPNPSFLTGLFLGVCLASGVAWYLRMPNSCRSCCCSCFPGHRKSSSLLEPDEESSLQASQIAEPLWRKVTVEKTSKRTFEGWMNEMTFYESFNFHINKTRSVFVTLDGSMFRLETPKFNLHRRAVFDERLPSNPDFVLVREFSLIGAEVVLLPAGLVRKRLWCKKYPICLRIVKTEKKAVNEVDEMDCRTFDVIRTFDVDGTTSGCERDERSALNVEVNIPVVIEGTKEARKSSCTIEVFLFARSNRDKEEWFRHLSASIKKTNKVDLEQFECFVERGEKTTTSKAFDKQQQQQTTFNLVTSESDSSLVEPTEVNRPSLDSDFMDYLQHMAKVLPAESPTRGEPSQDPPFSANPSPSETPLLSPIIKNCDVIWLNALMSRFLFDFLHDKYWAERTKEKLQRMLLKIHLPRFIEQLTVTEIDVGSTTPTLQRVSTPYLDDRGLWIDLDISYGGGFCITMETKCNFMRKRQQIEKDSSSLETSVKEIRSPAVHSDEEDSAESSTDDDTTDESSDQIDEKNAGSTSCAKKRFLHLVDKITQSSYFQTATDFKYIKRAIHEVSNTRLILNVEMTHLAGTLALNVPPPPTGRLWYGFRGDPHLELSVKPRVGDRQINIPNITEWITKKLELEFQRVYVMPNMEDLMIPLMCDHVSTD